jgi:hypothetical protein
MGVQPQAPANQIYAAPSRYLRGSPPQLLRESRPRPVLAPKLFKAPSQFFHIIEAAAVRCSHHC